MGLSDRNIRNVFVYALPKVAGYGLNLLTLPILTRLLTPAEYGAATFAWIVPSLLVAVLTLGVTGAAQRTFFDVRDDEVRYGALVTTAQLFLLLGLALGAITVWPLKEQIARLAMGSTEYGLAIYVTFFAAFLREIANFYLMQWQNQERATTQAALTVGQASVTTLAGLFFVWYFDAGYMGVLWGALLGAALSAGIGAVLFNRSIRPSVDLKILAADLRYGIQLVPKAFTGFVNRFFDRYMLNNMMSISAVGVYNVGQTVGNALFTLMNTVWSAFQPAVYREAFDGGPDASVPVGRMFTLFSFANLAPVMGLVLFAEEVIRLLAPPSYSGATDVIVIVGAAMATQIFGMFVGVQFAWARQGIWIFPISIVATLANVGANIVLVPRFGLVGAATSAAIMYLVLNGSLAVVGQRLYRIAYEWAAIAPMYLLVAFSAAAVVTMRHTDVAWPAALAVKLLALVLFAYLGKRAGVLTRENIARVLSALRGKAV